MRLVCVENRDIVVDWISFCLALTVRVRNVNQKFCRAGDTLETKLKDAVINGVMRTVHMVFDLAPGTFNLILVC